jgi:hypothetical protein
MRGALSGITDLKTMRRVRFEWQIAELIDDQKLWLGEVREPLLEPAFASVKHG